MLRIIPDEQAREDLALALDEICRVGAERMLASALQAEVADYLERHRVCRDEAGRAWWCATAAPAPARS